MKRIAVLGLVLLSCSVFAQDLPAKYQTPAPKPGDVVATVNGKPILASDIESLLWEWRGTDVTEDLISYSMVAQDAAKKGVVVSDAEVDKTVDSEMAALLKARPDGAEYMKSQGFTRSRLFLRLKAKLLMDKILEKDFHPEQYVKVSTILVKSPGTDAAAVSAAIAKVQSAYDRLQKGEKWDDVLAATTSEQQAIKIKGLLGWRERSAFPETTQKEMSTLAVGGITKPAQTQVGIQLFRIEANGADAKGDDLASLKNLYLNVARQQYVDKLRAESKIERLRK